MPTFLEMLAERDCVAEKSQLLRLQAEKRDLDRLRDAADARHLFEDTWASADPLPSSGASVAGLGSSENDLFHPGSIGRNSARPGSRRHGAQPPYYWTEQQHWMIVDAARTVEAFIPTAATMLDVLVQFIVFTGFEYRIVEKKKPGESPAASQDPSEINPQTEVEGGPGDSDGLPKPKSNPLVDKVQEFLDKWLKDQRFHEWEREIVRRTERDGETFIALDEGDEPGVIDLRAIEPEQIREPTGVAGTLNRQLGISGRGVSWRFGILTSRRDTSKPEAYNVVSQFSDTQVEHEVIDAEDMWHTKIGVDRQSKRGVSMFFPIVNDLPRVKKLLRNLTESASVQACVAWVEELPPDMAMTAPMGSEAVTSRTGRSASARTYDGPEIVRVMAGHKYTPGPLAGTGQSETLIQVLQAALRSIGARKQFPEGMVSGDASNANLASALVAEAPFVKARTADQEFYSSEFVRLIERVLTRAAEHGVLPEGENLLDKVDISVEMPPVVPRKAKEETERNAILNERGILSNQTWSSREDLDFEDEQRSIEEDPIEPPSIMLGLPPEELDEGEAEDDTAAENSTAADGDEKSTTGSSRKKKQGLGPKGAASSAGVTGTNTKQERV